MGPPRLRLGTPSGDPWVTLAAVAQASTHLPMGTAVTPLARRRPHVLAATVASLDQLSGGRVVLGVGFGGVPAEFSRFGEDDAPRVWAERLDEALDVVTTLWSGDRVDHHGPHYTVDGVTLPPLPVQRPRVPVWIALTAGPRSAAPPGGTVGSSAGTTRRGGWWSVQGRWLPPSPSSTAPARTTSP